MDKKIVSKVNIRRAVLGTCVVLAADGGASGGARPRKVTITLLRRRGCWRALSSRRVAVFAFPEASGYISVPAPLDLEYLFRCSGKADAAAMQIKICVAYFRGATRKARVSLEEFLEVLLHGGRPGSFHLYIYEDKVGLLQASQQFQALPTTWPLEQKTGKEKKATDDDATYNEWKDYLDKVFSVDDDEENTDNDVDTDNEWKVYLEKVFSVEDNDQAEVAHEDATDYECKEEVLSVDDDVANTDDDDDTYNEWKVYLEKVFSVEDNDQAEVAHENATDYECKEEVLSVDDDEENTDNDDDNYNEWKVYLEKVFSVEDNDQAEVAHENATDYECKEEVLSVDDDEENTDNDDDTYNQWKVYLEKVFSVEDNDQAEVAHEDATDYKCKEEVLSVDDDVANTDDEDDTYNGRKVLSETVLVDENNDLDEAVHEAEEAADMDGTAENEAFGDSVAEEKEASGDAAAEEEAPELGEASGSAAAEEDVPELDEASRSGHSATDREFSLQGDAPSPVAVSAASATASHAYRSLTVPHRFMARLTGPSIRLLEDLERSHDVSIVRVRRTLHIKGHRDAVLQCHRHMRGEIAEWRKQEAADAAEAQ
ncbi:aspartic and glutamic acid-rich protein-like isoform X2 [Eriocheir sinensis]|uniref:aspartic and glutamic acid-rich protein-like isoform X2 n=1 Tax=Eriocheir sinensis TaxID=95602 RepID=UPI0021C942ED|nr:aspartic and glutamic acid-rich protein-like isoform X2 [Eriocheir sinensis]